MLKIDNRPVKAVDSPMIVFFTKDPLEWTTPIHWTTRLFWEYQPDEWQTSICCAYAQSCVVRTATCKVIYDNANGKYDFRNDRQGFSSVV